MSGNWYFAKNGQRFGPFTVEQFRQMAASGLLLPDDMVWDEGGQRWLSASAVAGLFPDTISGSHPSPPPVSAAEGRPEMTGEPATVPPGLAAQPRATPLPTLAQPRIVRSAFWVVSTHVLTTGFAMPALATLVWVAVLYAIPLAPIQGFLIRLTLLATGYIGGTFYSLSYIRKTALIQQPLTCIKPSIITFVVLAVLGFAVDVWRFVQQQQDSSPIEVGVAIMGLIVFYAVITYAFAWITQRGFAQMEKTGQ